MTPADKHKVWQHMKQHSPAQAVSVRARKTSFGDIGLDCLPHNKNPDTGSNRASNNNNNVLTGTTNLGES